MALRFSSLPDSPQIDSLKQIASNLWRNQEVRAIWVEGSVALGTADPYSDVDLRLAVPADRLRSWEMPDLTAYFEDRCIACQRLFRSDEGILLHLLLDTGEMYDLGIQAVQQVAPCESTVVLGCRDPELAAKLAESPDNSTESRCKEPDPALIRQVIVEFWLNSHKHRKVLHRGLDPMVIVGLHTERTILVRLWAIDSTGQDYGATRPTIHSLTPQVRSVQDTVQNPLGILGGPGRSREELMAMITRNRDEVSLVGRALAVRYTFDYPENVEATVRDGWRAFVHPDQ